MNNGINLNGKLQRSKRKRFYRIRDVDIIPPPSDNIPIKRRSKALVDKLVAEGGSSITVIENSKLYTFVL